MTFAARRSFLAIIFDDHYGATVIVAKLAPLTG